MKFKTREHLRQPRGHTGPSGIGGARPLVLLNWNQGVYPRNEGTAPRTDTWTNISTPTLSLVGRRQGLALSDPSNAGGVQFGTDIEFGRPTSAVPVWLAAIYTHAPYFNAGSSVNTFANYGTGAGGIDGGAIFHVTSSNQLRAWLMSIDLTTSWSAVDGQTYHLLVARNEDRTGGLWIDGRLIGTGTSSTAQFPGASRVNLLSDAGLNERRARGVLHAYAYGEGDITAEAGRISSNLWQLFGKKRRIWVPVAAGAAGGTGTLAATLADATSAATGTLLIQGTASATLAAATSAATGTLAIKGTTSATLAAATSTATGALAIKGTTTATLDAAALAATGELQAAGSGTLTATLAAATVAATGTLRIAGTTTATLAAATSTATGTLRIQGTLTGTLAAATLAAEGTGAQVTTGTLSATLADATVSSAATLRIQGATTATLADASVVATGRVDIAATLGVTLDGAILVSTGSSLAAITGTLTATLADATLTAAATIADPAEVRPSAPPIGHGPALATRTPPALRRRAPNLSTRTR